MQPQFEVAILKIYQRKAGMILICKDPLSDDESEQRLISEEQFEKLKMLMPNTMWMQIIPSEYSIANSEDEVDLTPFTFQKPLTLGIANVPKDITVVHPTI